MTAFVLVFLPLLIGYAVTGSWIWDSWTLADSYYSHGPLLPVLAVFMIWAWRGRWSAVPLHSDRRGWLLLGPGLFLHLCGASLTIDSLSAFSLLLTIPGAVWLALGAGRARVLAPVLALALFAIPLPMFVTGRAAFELKEVAVGVALEVANVFGAGVSRFGARVAVDGVSGFMTVADPCSGLRSLVALTTLGYCVAFFMGAQTGARRWLLIAAAVPIALLANILRIAGICVLARHFGIPFATGTGHDLLSAGAWVAALVALLAVDALLGRRRRNP